MLRSFFAVIIALRSSVELALGALVSSCHMINELSSGENRSRHLLREIFLVLAAWAMLTVASLTYFTFWPRTLVGWLAAIFVGPVLVVALELVGELIRYVLGGLPPIRRSHEWVERRTSRRRFSWLRIGYALTLALPVLLVAVFVWWVSQRG